MTRERYWGLYDWAADTWWTEEFGGAKRKRFSTPQAALNYMRDNRYVTASGPRPFYVTRKPRPLVEVPKTLPTLVELALKAARQLKVDCRFSLSSELLDAAVSVGKDCGVEAIGIPR